MHENGAGANDEAFAAGRPLVQAEGATRRSRAAITAPVLDIRTVAAFLDHHAAFKPKAAAVRLCGFGLKIDGALPHEEFTILKQPAGKALLPGKPADLRLGELSQTCCAMKIRAAGGLAEIDIIRGPLQPRHPGGLIMPAIGPDDQGAMPQPLKVADFEPDAVFAHASRPSEWPTRGRFFLRERMQRRYERCDEMHLAGNHAAPGDHHIGDLLQLRRRPLHQDHLHSLIVH